MESANPISDGADRFEVEGGSAASESMALLQASFTPEQVAALVAHSRRTAGPAAASDCSATDTVADGWTDMFARFSETPTNWHQAAIFYCGSKDPVDRSFGNKLLAGSFLMVVLQLTACAGAFAGVSKKTCVDNDQCDHHGMYCLDATGMCEYCGHDPSIEFFGIPADHPDLDPQCDVDMQSQCLQLTYESAATLCHNATLGLTPTGYGNSAQNWCAVCVSSIAKTVDRFKESTRISRNIASMGAFDTATFYLCATFLSLIVVAELKDATLVEFGVARAASGEAQSLTSFQQKMFQLLSFMRRWSFLPGLVGVGVGMTGMVASDVTSICFNTIAILFLAEVDDVAYKFGLNEKVRARVEKNGRIMLTEEEESKLKLLRVCHLPLVTIFTFLILKSLGTGSPMGVILLPHLCFFVSGVAAALFGWDDGPKGLAISIVGSFLRALGGCIIYLSFFAVAYAA
jgi:hypothetical protein